MVKIKRLFCVWMTLIMAASTVAAGSFSAASVNDNIRLLGDANLDGEVNITDATTIQRYDVKMIDLSDEALTLADIDFDGEVTILDATWIRRYDVHMKAPDGIGKPITDVFTDKSLPVLRDSLDSTETASVRIYADQPDVPYMNVTDFYNQFYLAGTDLTEGMTCSRDGGVYTLANIAGGTAAFDIDAETIRTDDMKGFASAAHYLQVEMADAPDENYPFIKLDISHNPETTEQRTLCLGDYGIDLRGDDSGVYAPVATLCDIFATTNVFYVVYTGEKLYTCDYSKALQPKAVMTEDPDFESAVKADRTEAYADFCYRELCFSLDLWYGQPGQEWIHEDLQSSKIDDILTAKYPEIKGNLLSTDFRTYLTGSAHLLNGLLFDGGHTAVTSKFLMDDGEVLSETVQELKEKDYGQKFIKTLQEKLVGSMTRIIARNTAFNGEYYIERGDTAVICFDKFAVDYDGWKAFYAGNGERPLQGDTVGTVLYGLERAKQNPDIKNIVIDMSCNGGGTDYALLSIEWLMTGTGYIRFENEFNDQITTKTARFDMNFDGKFDENDVSPYTDYNYAVLTSKASFSCGNAFPWFMHEHGAMVLGQKSGGGACAIRIGSARGVEFSCSASSSRIIADSGESVDFGCPIDADLICDGENPYENFYDLTLLSEKINEFFAAG